MLPATIVILVLLFAAQSRGTARVAAFFSPIMVTFFAVNAVLGLTHIASAWIILEALSPIPGLFFIHAHGLIGFIVLGSVFLAVTGAEALYADMGHFGRRPIQAAWLFIVLPALVCNYLGQGALIITNPKAVENPFYLMAPTWALAAAHPSVDRGDSHRQPGRHHRRLFVGQPGDPARAAAAA